jgi:uncharacterized integral membrane protein (TIGR00698 family)
MGAMPNRWLPPARSGDQTAVVTQSVPAPVLAPHVRPTGGQVRSLTPGLVVSAAGVTAAMLLHQLVGSVGVLTWAVGLGVLVANLDLLPASVEPGIRAVVKKLLRLGVVLLGFSVSLGAVASLGLPVIVLVVGTLLTTLLGTLWLGLRAGLGKPRSLLLGTGFAICGASAVAGVQHNAGADEDDVASAIGMVTVFGTLAMIAVPLLQAPLGLDDRQLGMWAGASIHEVGQVIAAAGPAGQTAVAIAITIKLTRVLLLGPVVAGVSFSMRRNAITESTPELGRPPMVPVFVLGFLACVLVRSAGVLPDLALTVIGHVATVALGAALFGLGTAVRVRQLASSAGPALAVGAVSTLLVGTISLAGVLILG